MKKIIFVFILFAIKMNAQILNQKEINILLQKSQKAINELKLDSASFYSKKSILIAEKNEDKELIAKSFLMHANVLYENGKKNEARDYAKKTENIGKEINNIELILDAYLMLGNIHLTKYEDVEAIKYYQKIETISIQNKIQNKTLVRALENTGLQFYRGYDDGIKPPFQQAKIYFQRAFEIAKKINDNDSYYVVGTYIGSTLVEEKQYYKALIYYDKAYSYFKKQNNLTELTNVIWAYASLYEAWGKNDIAEKYYKENVTLNSIPNNYNGLARAHWSLAGYYLLINNDKKGIEECEKTLTNLKKESNIDIGLYSGTLYDLSEAYKRQGNFQKAHSNLHLYVIYNDSLNVRQNKAEFTEVEAKYQTEKKEQEIKLLSQVAQKQKVIYLSIVGLLLALGTFLFLGYRNKIKIATKLNELNELKSRFFANISHEFRTPLTLIKSPVQSLQSEIQNESQKSKLHLIDKNANRMLELVDQLLELSKIDNGNLKLLLKEGNSCVFLNSIIEPFAFQAKENRLFFVSKIEKTTENHYFDKDVIEKIVTNLLSNALKYTYENNSITFDSSIQNNQLKIVVSNSGTEIKKEELSKLFERFYQKEENKKGVGIGLSLVKELVDLYKGFLTTTIENGILSFIISLPLEKSNENAIIIDKQNDLISTESSMETTGELPVLLLVDDNIEIRTILRDIFKNEYQILEAQDGLQAFKIAQNEIPDCIISDVMMPKMDGFEFTKAIKTNELTSFIPVILLTAKTSDEAHLEGLKSKADSFLTKPFNNEIVKATVNQLLQERKKLHERYSNEMILKPTDIVINSEEEKFIEKLQSILDNELTNSDFSVDNFASFMGISRMQLHRKLKSLLGVSTTEFIRKERIKMATTLLKKREITIAEIAYSVGFNDASYFIRCFKEIHQCTPSEYQEKN